MWQITWDKNKIDGLDKAALSKETPGAYFSKVPKLLGPISGATISFISSPCRGSEPLNFTILFVFPSFKTCKEISLEQDQLKTCWLHFDNWLFELEKFLGTFERQTPGPVLSVQGLCPLSLKKTRPKTTGEDEREDVLQTAHCEADY